LAKKKSLERIARPASWRETPTKKAGRPKQ